MSMPVNVRIGNPSPLQVIEWSSPQPSERVAGEVANSGRACSESNAVLVARYQVAVVFVDLRNMPPRASHQIAEEAVLRGLIPDVLTQGQLSQPAGTAEAMQPVPASCGGAPTI